MCRIFTLLLYDYRLWYANCECYSIQPGVELHLCFIVCAACFELLYPNYKCRFTNYKHRKIQPTVELHPRFIVRATCFDVATADDTLIVNITLFNPWLNHGYVL